MDICMAAGIERLTDRQVKNAKKNLNDGGNLWLLLRRDTKVWAFRYMLNGKARKAGLGSYPNVSLSEARTTASHFRGLLKQGLDPLTEAQKVTQEKNKVPSFNSAAAQFILTNRHQWKNKKHAKQWISTLRTYAKPVIGHLRVSEITTDHIQAILNPIWTTKTETAKRLQSRIERVLDWAIALKYRTESNPARWRGNLDAIYPKPTKVKRVNNAGKEKHLLAMPYEEVSHFYSELTHIDTLASKALRLLILTACRSSEILHAQWQEIDFQHKRWVIPAERMKSGNEHRVPLTKDAIELLKSIPKLNQYVFPGVNTNKPLYGMAMLLLMRKLGFKRNGPKPAYVPHGFRSSFRDWCEEQSSFPHGVIERSLAHTIPNATERAYNRSDLFDKRRLLMDTWAKFVTSPNS